MGIKRWFRPAVDHLASWTGVLSLYQRRMRRGVTILMYHRVLPDDQCRDYPLASLAVPETAFAQQTRWLARHCRVLTVADAVGLLQSGLPTDRPVVCVTFDDGYRDNVEIAAPILEAADLRATFFVTTDLMGRDELFWYDRASESWLQRDEAQHAAAVSAILGQSTSCPRTLDDWMALLKQASPEDRTRLIAALESLGSSPKPQHDYRLMTFEQLKHMTDRGHEIGAHSRTHPLLPQLDQPALIDEIDGARRILQDRLGVEIKGFCYPNGDQDPRVHAQVRLAGYRYACTTTPGPNTPGVDPYQLRRLDITPQRVLTADGVPDPLGFRAEVTRFREVLR
jgi:peptidoglycan/xylan/chitin deacetylase (PgdA/CDA1 family)